MEALCPCLPIAFLFFESSQSREDKKRKKERKKKEKKSAPSDDISIKKQRKRGVLPFNATVS